MDIINAGSSREDVALTKFSHFTEVEKMILITIRKYNSKCSIVVITDNDSTFHEAKRYVLTTQMFNVYIMRKDIDEESYTMHEVCAFCSSGVTDMNLYNTWTLKRGFTIQIKYTSSFKGEFFGARLRVGVYLTNNFSSLQV